MKSSKCKEQVYGRAVLAKKSISFVDGAFVISLDIKQVVIRTKRDVILRDVIIAHQTQNL